MPSARESATRKSCLTHLAKPGELLLCSLQCFHKKAKRVMEHRRNGCRLVLSYIRTAVGAVRRRIRCTLLRAVLGEQHNSKRGVFISHLT